MPTKIDYQWWPKGDKYGFTQVNIGETYFYPNSEITSSRENFIRYASNYARRHGMTVRIARKEDGVVLMFLTREEEA